MHAKRKTLTPKDVHLVRTIVSIWDPSCWLAKKQEKTTTVDWTQIKTVMAPKRTMPPGIFSRARAEAAKKASKARPKRQPKGKPAITGTK